MNQADESGDDPANDRSVSRWPRTAPKRTRTELRLLVLAGLIAFCPAAGPAQEPITLDQALREARAANARLPIPATEIAIAREKRNEARAERWLRVAVEGDFVYAPPSGYDPVVTNAGEFRLQAIGRQPLYDGGARRAAVARADAQIEAAVGRYRVEEKDLELEVISRYNEVLSSDEETTARREGISRLEGYRTWLRSRKASGQAVAPDLLKTEVRLASEQASLLEAEKRAAAARMELNDRMGRDPATPLRLASLPAPSPGGAPPEPADWAGTPEVAAAQADARAAEAAVAIARAEGRPHLDLSADTGFWGSDTSRLVPLDVKARNPDATLWDRIRRDAGYSATLSFSWPIFDFGAIRARVAQSNLALRQALQKVEVARRDSHLNWSKARAALETLRREIDVLSAAAPAARDAFLETESRFRGGAATSLEVLDSYASAIDASVRLSDALARFRIAEALLARWGTP